MERQEMTIDSEFPGGNVQISGIDGDKVRFRQDLRDSRYWFYWAFRVREAQGRTLTFKMDPRIVGVRGPAVSTDDGATWRWMGASAVTNGAFSYLFDRHANEVYFSFGMPYVQRSLERFLKKHERSEHLRVGELCTTDKGRSAEKLLLGCLEGRPRYKLIICCRHHACEMMANYVLEGLIERVLDESAEGRWLRRNVAFFVIPFVDKDGVEEGDQGKNRRPHDHGQDYSEGRYPTVRAIKEQLPAWIGDTPAFVIDVHCPGPFGTWHQVLMSPTRRDDKTWLKLQPFLKILDARHTGPLRLVLSESEQFIGWKGKPTPRDPSAPPRSFHAWSKTLKTVRWGVTFEIPYADSRGAEVNQNSARTWGADLATALARYLQAL